MPDIVDRLNDQLNWDNDLTLPLEAAEEIVRLRQDTNVLHADICAENDNMRAEIERLQDRVAELQLALADMRDRAHEEGIHHFVKLADAALCTNKGGGE